MALMESQEFCLKYNSHEQQLSKAFSFLLEQEQLVDVTIACEGRSLKAHRAVLSAFSVYFQKLLIETTHPHPIIILKDIRFPVLKALIHFMYQGEVNVKHDLLASLLNLADTLEVRGLARSQQHVTPISPVAAKECHNSEADTAEESNTQHALCKRKKRVSRLIPAHHTSQLKHNDTIVKEEMFESTSPEQDLQEEDLLSAKDGMIETVEDDYRAYHPHNFNTPIFSSRHLLDMDILESQGGENVITNRGNSSQTTLPMDSYAGPHVKHPRFRTRWNWTEEQLNQLETWFAVECYPTAEMMQQHADNLAQMFPQWPCPSRKSINYWFQNKRRSYAAKMKVQGEPNEVMNKSPP